MIRKISGSAKYQMLPSFSATFLGIKESSLSLVTLLNPFKSTLPSRYLQTFFFACTEENYTLKLS